MAIKKPKSMKIFAFGINLLCTAFQRPWRYTHKNKKHLEIKLCNSDSGFVWARGSWGCFGVRGMGHKERGKQRSDALTFYFRFCFSVCCSIFLCLWAAGVCVEVCVRACVV